MILLVWLPLPAADLLLQVGEDNLQLSGGDINTRQPSQSINQSAIKQSVIQANNQLINQKQLPGGDIADVDNQSISQSVNQSVDQSINQSFTNNS